MATMWYFGSSEVGSPKFLRKSRKAFLKLVSSTFGSFSVIGLTFAAIGLVLWFESSSRTVKILLVSIEDKHGLRVFVDLEEVAV